MPKLKNAIELKVPTVLPTSYGAWVSDELDLDGLSKIKLLLVVSGSYNGASIQIKGQVVEGGKFFEEHGTDGAADEASVTVTADGSYSIEYQAPSFDRARFLAKRTGGSQGDLRLSVLAG